MRNKLVLIVSVLISMTAVPVNAETVTIGSFAQQTATPPEPKFRFEVEGTGGSTIATTADKEKFKAFLRDAYFKDDAQQFRELDRQLRTANNPLLAKLVQELTDAGLKNKIYCYKKYHKDSFFISCDFYAYLSDGSTYVKSLGMSPEYGNGDQAEAALTAWLKNDPTKVSQEKYDSILEGTIGKEKSLKNDDEAVDTHTINFKRTVPVDNTAVAPTTAI